MAFSQFIIHLFDCGKFRRHFLNEFWSFTDGINSTGKEANRMEGRKNSATDCVVGVFQVSVNADNYDQRL